VAGLRQELPSERTVGRAYGEAVRSPILPRVKIDPHLMTWGWLGVGVIATIGTAAVVLGEQQRRRRTRS